MKFRKIAALFICMALLICVFPADAGATSEGSNNGLHRFKDVSENHWAFDPITWMVDNKIVEGDGSGNFLPNREVTRGEYAKMMVLTLRLKLINPDVPSFKDVKGNGWQYKYVETARPYMTGFRAADGEYFHPSGPAVREDMAVALVKALGFANETADESQLSIFSDSGSISPNLRKYVAIAVKHELMQGYDQDGKRVFGPQTSLNRATAAQLLYNAFKGNEEKITFDEEKVTYEDEDPAVDDGYTVPKVSAQVVGDHVVISWDKITSSRFAGYKVVISREDSTPKYPDNGYFAYITDRDTVSTTIHAGDGYNGGDIDGELKSGINYYFSITVLYGDRNTAGNVIRLQIP